MLRKCLVPAFVLLGTLSSATALEITNVTRDAGQLGFEWRARTGGLYSVLATPALTGGWETCGSTTGTSDAASWTDPGPADRTSRFYRLQIAQPALSNVTSWAYNIQHVDTSTQREELVGTHFDMYVLEPAVTEKGNSDFDIRKLVQDIRGHVITQHHRNPIILAYVDIGEAEDWRWYWKAGWGVGNPKWIVGDDPNGWTGNYPVAYWDTNWWRICIYGTNGMSHVEETLKAGFDGIYMDWVEAFSDTNVLNAATNVYNVTNTAEAMFDFIEGIREYARELSTNANPNYLIVAQNASDLYELNTNRYEQLIDAIALEAIWLDGTNGFDVWDEPGGYNVWTTNIYPGWTQEVLDDLEPMKGRLPIFCCEYAQDIGGTNYASLVYTNLAPKHGFIPYCTQRSLSRLSTSPYPRGYIPHDY